jgi:UDP-N-acetylglucosamine--N-acetylmuramyl-(pentapeptide) pyrophosphoryl-undecaprenol N-acetylglucosamine transferase
VNGLRVIITGGGTGGHLFPGIAIAQAIMDRDPRNRVWFVGTDRPFEREAVSRAGFVHHAIPAGGIKRVGVRRQARTLLTLPLGLMAALGIIHRVRPDLVIGVGGYSAFPVVLAAGLSGVAVVLQEQNTWPGMTNRLLSPLAQRIYISFPETPLGGGKRKCRWTGNPVRREIRAGSGARVTRNDGSMTVFVLGGSQGAHALNLAVVDALDHLRRPDRFRFIHQTGPADLELVASAYRAHGISAEVRPFFRDMARCYREADLLVARAGATTVAEVTVAGRPALFVPFPYAADDHQTRNARFLADAGAAEIIPQHELSGSVLADRLTEWADPAMAGLDRMAARSRALGRPHAADAIVDDIHRLLAGRQPSNCFTTKSTKSTKDTKKKKDGI